MDCRTAQLLLEFARPMTRELDVTEAEALESHLADCLECARRARTTFALDARISAAMRDVPLPDGLRERLLAGLARPPRASSRQHILRQLGNLAAAAAILVVVGLVWTHRGTPPDIQGDDLVMVIHDEIANPAPEQVECWLKKQGVHVPAPTNFDYRLLSHYHMTNLQGQDVPMLFFVRSENGRCQQARVYLLNCNKFNLAATLPPAASIVGMQLMPHPSDGRYAYLVVFTGDLELFLAKDGPPTL